MMFQRMICAHFFFHHCCWYVERGDMRRQVERTEEGGLV